MFGQEINPDEEEQEFELPPLQILQLKFQKQVKGAIQSGLFCLGFYGVGSLFLSSVVDTKNTQPINRINFQKSKQRALANIYMKNTTCYMIFNEQVPKMKELHLSKFINKNFFMGEQILIYTGQARSTLKQQLIVGKLNHMTSQDVQKKDLYGNKFPSVLHGAQAEMLQWGCIYHIPILVFIGIHTEYEITREQIDEIFAPVNGKFRQQSKYDITAEIKKYNMGKYSNKLYL